MTGIESYGKEIGNGYYFVQQIPIYVEQKETLNLTERFIILRQYRKENDVR
jgi:hypothetical protein